VYWKVFVTLNSQEGWLAEGDPDSYFIEPLPNPDEAEEQNL
jgi:hypothetical protein